MNSPILPQPHDAGADPLDNILASIAISLAAVDREIEAAYADGSLAHPNVIDLASYRSRRPGLPGNDAPPAAPAAMRQSQSEGILRALGRGFDVDRLLVQLDPLLAKLYDEWEASGRRWRDRPEVHAERMRRSPMYCPTHQALCAWTHDDEGDWAA